MAVGAGYRDDVATPGPPRPGTRSDVAGRFERDADLRRQAPLVASGVALGILAVAAVLLAPVLLPIVAVPAVGLVVMHRRSAAGPGLQIVQMERLRQAE